MWQQQQQLNAENGQNNLISRDCKQRLNQKANSMKVEIRRRAERAKENQSNSQNEA